MNIRRTAIYVHRLTSVLGLRQAIRFVFARYIDKKDLMELHVEGLTHPVFCRPTMSDIRSLWQIFRNADCHIDLQPPPNVIIDGGAYVGYASLYFAMKFPEAVILAIEPDTNNVAAARRNLQHHPNVRVVQGAIWSHDCHMVVEDPQAASWAFRVKEVPTLVEGAFQGRSLDSFIHEFELGQADLIKLDIEGAEREIFRSGAPPCVAKTRALIIEVHGQDAERAVDHALQPMGFHSHIQGEKLHYLRSSP